MKLQTPEHFLRVVICPNCGSNIVATTHHMPPPSFYPIERIHYVYTPDPPYRRCVTESSCRVMRNV